MSGVDVKYEGGEVVVSALEGGIELKLKAAKLAKPVLEGLEADIESGKIDLIKGTDLDKAAAIAAIEGVKKLVGI